MVKKTKEIDASNDLVDKLTEMLTMAGGGEMPCTLKCKDCIESYDDHANCHKAVTLDIVDMKRAIEEIIEKVEEMYEWMGKAEARFHINTKDEPQQYT